MKSHKPVELMRGNDRFTADSLDYDNLDRVLELRGPRARRAGAARRRAKRTERAMDKLVFITGASSGIGQALAWRYHQAGWRLALVARRTAEIEAWARAQGLRPTAMRSTAPTWPTPTASWPRAAPASRARACRTR